IHEYFKRKVSEWDIVGFLNECTDIESYRQKIECYLKSLELIADSEKDQRCEKALELLKLYRQAIFSPSHKGYAGAQGNYPDKKRSKEWEKVHSNMQINIRRSTINGTVRGITNGVYGTMSEGVFDVKPAPKRSNQKERDNKDSKRLKINDYFLVRTTTPQCELDQQEDQAINSNDKMSNQHDSSILRSTDSKINQENQSLCSSVTSSNINCEEDIEHEYYDTKKRMKVLYSWEDAVNKIDFRDTSKTNWVFGNYNLSNEFRNFQMSTIQQVKKKPYLCYKKDIHEILCLSNIMLIERTKPTYLSCNSTIWDTICRRQTPSGLTSAVNNIILEYSSLLNSFTPLDEIEDRWCTNFSRVTELNKEDRANFCLINKDNEDTFVHNTLHDLINEIFRDSMLELVWANSESSSSKNRRSSNKENDTVKGNKPDFKILTNTRDEILFGEVKPRDSSSVLVKKDLVKLAEFQAGTLDELIKKYGNRIGIISFGIWVCGMNVHIYEMDLNYDGIYRMILVANVSVPTEREKIINLVPVLEAFYNIKHRISEVSTVIASNTPPSSPSRSSYGRMPTPSPKLVKIAIAAEKVELETKNAELLKQVMKENVELKARIAKLEQTAEKNTELKDRITKLEQKQIQIITNEQEASPTKDISPLIEGHSGEEKGITPNPLPEIEHSSTQSESSTGPKISTTSLPQDIIDDDSVLDFVETIHKEKIS
ncbi:3427_t:CDS:10, partial [Paraglomus occultum]